MDSGEPTSANVVESVRNISISRRGGVRTRGGRLPPILLREIPNVASQKKVVAPKIPQRRVKKEQCDKPTQLIKKEPSTNRKESSRGRGREAKVYLQTEGTFLGQGPAAKLKKEPVEASGYSRPRSSKTAVEKEEFKIDSATIRDLLTFYEANEAYEDDLGSIAPYRLPLIKSDLISKMKTEPVDIVKKEPVDGDVKQEIKSEDDYWNKLEGKVFTKLTKEIKNDIEEFCNVKDEGMLILLHWPDCLPITSDRSKDETQDTGKKNEVEIPSFIDKLPEGKVGKLQFLKSGRKRLILGPIIFEFVEGTVSECSREVVSIQTNGNEGNLTVMGKIDRTMILTPIIDNFITKVK